MKTKIVIKVVLLSFVAVSLGGLFFQQVYKSANGSEQSSSTMEGDTASRPEPSRTAKPDRVIVYYFHTTYRCPACRRIENYTKEAVETLFTRAIREGRMEFHAVNVQEQENKHFIKDYKLHTKSVVVVDIEDGKQARWKNLTRVWHLLRNKDAFFKYIRDEVNSYLQGK